MAIGLLDTNILIDFLAGVPQALTEVSQYSDVAISNITYMEVVIGLRRDVGLGTITPAESAATMAVIGSLDVIPIDQHITNTSIDIRANSILGPGKKIKLPDAIIYATAQTQGRYMITRDPGGFTGPLVRIAYQIKRQDQNKAAQTDVIDYQLPPPV
jgi:hypothetical protein